MKMQSLWLFEAIDMADRQTTISESKILEIAKSLVGKTSIHPDELDQIVKDYFSAEKNSMLTGEVEERLARLNPTENEDPLLQLTLRLGLVSTLAKELSMALDYNGIEVLPYDDAEIKKNSRVKIRRDSEYFPQNNGIGRLQDNFGSNPAEYREVTFDNGDKNQYRKIDLELADPFESLEKIIAKNKALAATVPRTNFSQFSAEVVQQLIHLFTDEPMKTRPRNREEYFVGDKIRMTRGANSEYTYSKEGSEGEVISKLPEDKLLVRFAKFTGSNSPPPPYDCKVHPRFIELLDGSREINIYNFRIGDRIRMSRGATANYKHSKEGSEGVIDSRGKEDGSYIVKFTKLTGSAKEVVPQAFEVHQEYMERLNPMAAIGLRGAPADVAARLVSEATNKIVKDTRELQRAAVTKQVEEDVNFALVEGLGLFTKENDFYIINQQKLLELLSKKIFEDSKTRAIGTKVMSSKDKAAPSQAAGQTAGCDTVLLLDISKYNPETISAARDAAISMLYLSNQKDISYEVINLNDAGETISLDNLLIENIGGTYSSATALGKAVKRLENGNGPLRLLYLATDCDPDRWNLNFGRKEQVMQAASELSEEGIQLVVVSLPGSASNEVADSLKEAAAQANGDMYTLSNASQMAPTLITSYMNRTKRVSPASGAK
jgi:hypothetical protein